MNDSDCGSAVRAVASDTRDLRFESSHRQIEFTINCIEETKIRKKRPGMAQFKYNERLLEVIFDIEII